VTLSCQLIRVKTTSTLYIKILDSIIVNNLVDDLAIMDSTVTGLQIKLNLLSEYCKTWGLTVNRAKTKIICFKPGRKPKREKWHIDGEQIKVVDTFEYLGITLSTSISWSHAIKSRVDKATKAIYITLSHTKKFGRIRAKTLLDIFD
jgi:hypothetical protein